MASHANIPLVRYGGIVGVTLFFALSGYLITTILLRERERTGRLHFGHFYARRALRLLPALVVSVALGDLLAVTIGGHGIKQVATASLYSLFYINNFAPLTHASMEPFGQYWSLSLEEQYYLLWPSLLLLLTIRRVRRFAVPIILTAAGVSIALRFSGSFTTPQGFDVAYNMPQSTVWALLFGSAVAVAVRDGWRVPAWAAPAGMAGMLFLATVVGLRTGLREAPGAVSLTLRLIVGPVAGALACLVVARCAVAPVPWLAHPVLRYFGRISYALYLWHGVLDQVVGAHLGSSGVRGLVSGVATAALAVGVAELSWRFVESPFLRRKDRLERRWSGKAEAERLSQERPLPAP